jgi:HK97 family phage major capsid protein
LKDKPFNRKEWAMSETVTRLQERRQKVWADAKALADKAADENRNFDGEEEKKWRELDSELDALDSRIQDILKGEQRAKDAEDSVARLAGKPVERGGGGPVGQTAEQEAEELRKFLKGETRSYELALPNAVERRTLLDSNTPLPTSFVGQLYKYLVDTSSIRQANPSVFSTSSGENLVVPRSTAEGAAVWTGEGAALTAGDPTLSSVTLGAYKVGKIIQLSSELLDDKGFDVVGFMAEHAGRNIGIAVDTAYVSGTGTNQPSGFIQAATVALTAATGTASTTGLPTSGASVGADVLIDLFHSVIPQYRPRSSFLMNDSTIKVVRKLKDTTGQYLWQPALVAGQPDTILGRPVYADPNMDSIGVSKKPIAFGDFGGYFIRDVTPLRFERSDDFAFGNDLISFRALYRTDGKLGDTQAIKTYLTASAP